MNIILCTNQDKFRSFLKEPFVWWNYSLEQNNLKTRVKIQMCCHKRMPTRQVEIDSGGVLVWSMILSKMWKRPLEGRKSPGEAFGEIVHLFMADACQAALNLCSWRKGRRRDREAQKRNCSCHCRFSCEARYPQIYNCWTFTSYRPARRTDRTWTFVSEEPINFIFAQVDTRPV